jgi:tetratricopeptide (TPR) repeat protein
MTGTGSMDNAKMEASAEKEFVRGLKALQDGDSLAALSCFERAVNQGRRPAHLSYFGYCVAKERGQVQKGIGLCSEAMEGDPENAVHFVNLGRIYLLAGNKQEAISVFRKGLALGPNEEITGLLDAIGTRAPLIFPSLSRKNPLNRYLGKLLGWIGFR